MQENILYQSKPNKAIMYSSSILVFIAICMLFVGFILIKPINDQSNKMFILNSENIENMDSSINPAELQEIINETFSKLNILFYAAIIFIIVSLIGSLIYMYYEYQSYDYKITNRGVYLKGGILFKKNYFIPINKITNIEVTQNIAERLFSCFNLYIETAGENSAEIKFEYIKDAEKPSRLINDLLEKKANTDSN